MLEPTVLVTQKLHREEKKIFYEYGLHCLEVAMIQIDLIDFQLPNTIFDYLLVTSQNTVKSMLLNSELEQLKQYPVLCVGRQTQDLLEKNGWQVQYFADYAKDLIKLFLLKENPSVLFLNGNLRRNILVDYMRESGIFFQEIEVYQNRLTPSLVRDKYDAIVFFSPSAVDSFYQHNSLQGKQVFCIGETTAKAVGKDVLPMLPIFPSRKETLLLCANQLKRLNYG